MGGQHLRVQMCTHVRFCFNVVTPLVLLEDIHLTFKLSESLFFQLYHGENKLIINEMMTRSTQYKTNMLSWNSNPLVDMYLHLNTLSRFQLFVEMCAYRRSSKYQLYCLWSDRSDLLLNARQIALEASMLTMRLPASLLTTQHLLVPANTEWFVVKILCLSRATYPHGIVVSVIQYNTIPNRPSSSKDNVFYISYW